MLPADTVICRFEHGVATCVARQPSSEVVYQQLAARMKTALGQLQAMGVRLPVQEITLGSTIGASMVIAVQGVVGLLSVIVPLPPSLQPLFDPNMQPPQLVAVVGNHADEIVAYVDAALLAQPDAFRVAAGSAKTAPQQPIGAASQALNALFTKDRLVAIGVGVGVIGGLIALARSSDRRLSGKVDRSRLFHDPNAVYDDDDGDDGNDADDEPEPPGPVIDAESVEVAQESEPAA